MVRIWTPIIVSETNHHNNIDFTLEHPTFATSEYNTYLSMVDASKWGSLRTPTYFILGLPTAATGSLATFFFSGMISNAQNEVSLICNGILIANGALNKVSGICNDVLIADGAPNKVSRSGAALKSVCKLGYKFEQPRQIINWAVAGQQLLSFKVSHIIRIDYIQ